MLVFYLNEVKQAWVWKKPPTFLCDLQVYPVLLFHTNHKLSFPFLAEECHCEADQVWQFKCVPQGLSSTMPKILVILVDQTVWPQLQALEKEAVLLSHKTNKTHFYKGVRQGPFLFISPFVTLNQKSEYENSFLLFLLYFPSVIKKCPCFFGEK